MANTYLTRSKSTPTNDKIGTISFWIKRNKITSEQTVFLSGSGSIDSNIYFNGSNDKLHVYDYQSGAFTFQYVTTRVFRDTSSWYAITVEIDTTLSTADDRVKIYINGVRETAFDTSTAPSQNATPLFFTSANPFYIGAYRGTSGYFDGLLSHFNYTDGYAYGASTFGSTDSTTGEWQINTSPSVTYGTNGFFILKDGNSVTDQSGNSNNFTLGGGTLTNTEDCPSNVFATFNPLDAFYTTPTFTNGNTTLSLNPASSKDTYVPTTLGMTAGKYYAEAKFISGVAYTYIGITDTPATASKILGDFTNSARIRGDDGVTRINNVASTTLTTWTTNDIIGIGVDLTNLKIYYSKNGVWMNSANPSAGTGGLTITAPDYAYFFAWQCNSGSTVCEYSWNFGNGYFGTTAVSSAGTNASGNGVFEYDVPTGFSALSTKGLNE